jgi:hypothetical protein
VKVTSGVDIWTAFVNGSVNDETSCVNRLLCTPDTIAILINVDHIRDGQ